MEPEEIRHELARIADALEDLVGSVDNNTRVLREIKELHRARMK